MKRAAYLFAIVFFLLLLAVPPAGETAPQVKVDQTKEETVRTAPVMLDRTAIFPVAGYYTTTAESRAGKISSRIAALAEDYSVRTDAIRSVDIDELTYVAADDNVIMTVLNSDAKQSGVTRQQLAGDIAGKIRLSVEKYREARAPKNITRGAIMSAIATLVLLVLLLLLRFLFRRLRVTVETRKAPAIRIQNFEILRTEQVSGFLLGLIRTIRLLTLLLLIYLYVQFVLSSFPWTQPFSGELLRYLLVPLKTMGVGLIGYIPNLIFLVVLVFVTHYVLKFMRLFAQEVEKGSIVFSGFYPEWAKPTYKIARFAVIAFAAVVAFPYFPGSESPAFKGISIFLGVLLSLGSSSTVSNMIAGLDMTYRRAFLKGDWVKIGDLVGEVTRMRLLVSHLRTFKNEEVVIPNAVIQNSHVTNYSSMAREQGLILHTAVTIGYNTPWRQIHAFLLQAAERTSGLLRDPPPFVLQTSLDDFYVRYELNAYTDMPQEMLNIYSDLHQNIQDAFNEFEVQIMSPHYIDDPKSPAVVPRERWYEPPAKNPGQEADERS
jgi:small-conductance mechanosensitive channel